MSQPLPVFESDLSAFEEAQKLYGVAFEHADWSSVMAAQKDFGAVAHHERQFILGHLLYLLLKGQAETQQLMGGLLVNLEHLTGATHALGDQLAPPMYMQPLPTDPASPDLAAVYTPLDPPLEPADPVSGPTGNPSMRAVSFAELEAQADTRQPFVGGEAPSQGQSQAQGAQEEDHVV